MYNWINKIAELQAKRSPAVLITITATTGSAPCKAGTKMILTKSGELFGSIGGGRLELQVIEDAKSCLSDNLFKQFSYPLGAKFGQCCGGKVEVTMDVINQEANLYIFGAGHVGTALGNLMVNTAFNVHLIDSRPKWFEDIKLAKGITSISEPEDQYDELINWEDDRNYIVVMTHSHDLDQAIIEFSLPFKNKYLGLIGSQTKWNRFKKRISDRKADIDLETVHCPVGLDIGSQTPQEIAISIAAELLKEYYGK